MGEAKEGRWWVCPECGTSLPNLGQEGIHCPCCDTGMDCPEVHPWIAHSRAIGAQRDRLHADLLGAMAAAGIATPAEGYLEARHCVSGDVERLAKERDSARMSLTNACYDLTHAKVCAEKERDTARVALSRCVEALDARALAGQDTRPRCEDGGCRMACVRGVLSCCLGPTCPCPCGGVADCPGCETCAPVVPCTCYPDERGRTVRCLECEREWRASHADGMERLREVGERMETVDAEVRTMRAELEEP